VRNCRLAEAEFLRGQAEVPMAPHGVENAQQVQVELIHFIHYHYSTNSFGE
jgi:hypothetical protein